MLFTETSFLDGPPIEGYGINSFKINNKIYKGGLFVFSKIILGWNGFSDFSFYKKNLSELEVLFIGTGVKNKKLNKKFYQFLINKNITMECFNTPTACRAYNITISSSRKAGALLMPI